MSSEKLSLELIYSLNTEGIFGSIYYYWDWNLYDDYADSIFKYKVNLSGKKPTSKVIEMPCI